MNFKSFFEECYLLDEAKGVISKEEKARIMPDDVDKDLYLKFSAKYSDDARNSQVKNFLQQYGIKPSVSLGSKVVRARYAIAGANGHKEKNSSLQQEAEKSNTYFINPKGEFATLVANGKEISTPLDIKLSTLIDGLEHTKSLTGATVNVIPHLPHFGHPTVSSGYAGVTPERLGLTGANPEKVGWLAGYKKKGVAVAKVSDEEAKEIDAYKKRLGDKPYTGSMGEKERELVAPGNYFVDSVLFASKEMPSGLQDAAGNDVSNKDLLNMINTAIRRKARRGDDPQDILAYVALEIRNKYGSIKEYPNANAFVNSIVQFAVREYHEEMAPGSSRGIDPLKKHAYHGKFKARQARSGQLGYSKNAAAKTSLSPDEDAEKPLHFKQPSIGDLKRRLDLSRPEFADSDTREEVPEEPESQTVKTYKVGHGTAEDEAEEKFQKDIEQKYGKKPQLGKPEGDIERATPDELERRKREFYAKLGRGGEKSATEKPGLARLRARFGLK